MSLTNLHHLTDAAISRRWSLTTLGVLITLARVRRPMGRAELTRAVRRADNVSQLVNMTTPLLKAGLIRRSNGDGCYLYQVTKEGLAWLNNALGGTTL